MHIKYPFLVAFLSIPYRGSVEEPPDTEQLKTAESIKSAPAAPYIPITFLTSLTCDFPEAATPTNQSHVPIYSEFQSTMRTQDFGPCHLLRLLPVTCLLTFGTLVNATGNDGISHSLRTQTRSSSTFNLHNQDNLAVYWGQAPGWNDKRLSELCNEPSVNVVIIGFVRDFSGPQGYPRFDFGHGCVYYPKSEKDLPPQCSELAEDISTCQHMGKPVLISIGGGSSDMQFTFPTPRSAIDAATLLWQAFVAPQSGSEVAQPFPGVHVDGFDIDHENGSNENFETFVQVLRSLTAHSERRVILSSSTSCSGKDLLPSEALQMMDFISVRFFNARKCEWSSAGFEDSLHAWCQLLASLAIHNSMNVYGSPRLYAGAKSFQLADSGTGYVHPDDFSSLLSEAKKMLPFCFGGAMLWDGSMGMANKATDGINYLDVTKNAMG